MNAMKSKVGDEVFYVPLERAEIVAISEDRTHATIKLLSGSQKGQLFRVFWDDLKTVNK